MTLLQYVSVASPVGPLTLCASAQGLCHIEFGTAEETLPKLQGWARKHYGGTASLEHAVLEQHEELRAAAGQLADYFAGTRHDFTLALDLQGTPFQRKVWQALTEIPFGETRSYKEIAATAQAPKAVRAVGGANNRNPVPFIVPCHRVIGADGQMVGYGGGVWIKQFLLQLEGWESHKMNQHGVKP